MRSFSLRTSLVSLFLQCAISALAQAKLVVGGVELEYEVGAPGVLGDVDDELQESADDREGGEERSWEPVVAPLP